MFVKNFKYTDFNGVEREENIRFHLTKAEIYEMELTTEGGLAELINRIVKANDSVEIIKIFKEIILKSYGEMSPDGKYFLKEDENGNPLSRKFAQTEAYSMLFTELATDDKAASEFINGIMPRELIEEAKSKGLLTDVNIK